MNLTTQIITVLASIIPISLIASLNIPKFFFKLSNKLSRTTTICTSLTGILTKEPLEVKTIFFDKYKAVADLNAPENHSLKLLDTNSKLEINIKKTELQKDFPINLMAITATLCHYKKIHHLEEITEHFLKTCAIDLKKIKEEYEIIIKIQTNEEKKFSSIVAINNQTKEIFAFSKGNPRKILERCTRIYIDGKKTDIDYQLRHRLKKRIEKLNRNGQKVIAFAYKALPLKRLNNYSEQFAENDLVLIGLIGFVENINTELIPYIEEIKKNNIKTYILTSAKERKAVSVAEQLKIINTNYFEAINGRDLKDLNDQKLTKMLSNKEKDYIFCELKPADRSRILNTLKQNGEIVTIASKKHHHGIKELLESIDKSRKNRKNRKKLIFHALNCKIAEFLLAIAALILKVPLPLSLTLIITIDILFNIILELALNTFKNETENIQTSKFSTQLLLNGLATTIIIGGIYFWNLIRFGWYPGEEININSEAYLKSSTIIFILLALIQIIAGYHFQNPQKPSSRIKLFSNLYLTLTTIICLLMINILTSYETLQKLFGLTDLSAIEWGIIAFALIVFILTENIRKLFIKKPSDENNNTKDQLSENKSHS